jgi:hypothetical protein
VLIRLYIVADPTPLILQASATLTHSGFISGLVDARVRGIESLQRQLARQGLFDTRFAKFAISTRTNSKSQAF